MTALTGQGNPTFGSEHDRLLRLKTVELMREYEDNLSAGQVLAAMTRAKPRVRELYASSGLPLPAPNDYVDITTAMARHALNALVADRHQPGDQRCPM